MAYNFNPQSVQNQVQELKKFFNWIAKESPLGKSTSEALNNLGQTGDFLNQTWKGLTGQTSAEATLLANERNIQNQNYWNTVTMAREDTAHQREVADLQAAGLNPWLAMGNGAQSAAMNTAQVDPVDGSKILSATTGMALVALIKLLAKKV